MIGKLKGTIDSIKPSEVVLDVGGVGYVVSIPFSTHTAIVDASQVSLHIHTHVREDQIRLFGFFSEEEKALFEVLIHIQGIGPSIALSVLSGIEPERLYDAVQNNNPAPLTAIPGIGKSKAEKLVFELKRKLKRPKGSTGASAPSAGADAVEALVSLGFDERKAAAAVDGVLKDDPSCRIEHLVKNALRILSA